MRRDNEAASAYSSPWNAPDRHCRCLVTSSQYSPRLGPDQFVIGSIAGRTASRRILSRAPFPFADLQEALQLIWILLRTLSVQTLHASEPGAGPGLACDCQWSKLGMLKRRRQEDCQPQAATHGRRCGTDGRLLMVNSHRRYFRQYRRLGVLDDFRIDGHWSSICSPMAPMTGRSS